MNCEIIEATDGHSAIDRSSEADLDLILLDMMMPDMSGEEVCRYLRDQPGFDVPIIFLSARIQREDILKGLQAGAFDYLTKPYDLDLLKFRIDTVLRYRQSLRTLKGENEQLRKLIK